jgi:hypothetical protein
MEMISQRMNAGNKVFNIVTPATDGCQAQPAGAVLDSGKKFVLQPCDLLMDLESTRLMEERYFIGEEGLF